MEQVTVDSTPQTSRPGRPRDKALASHVFNVALQIYGETGWSGFHLSKVSALGGIGKSSLYSRWGDRDVLLKAAFSNLITCPGPVGNSAREILIHEADFRLRLYLGKYRTAIRRLFVEATQANEPILREIFDDVFVNPVNVISTRLWDFKASGELHEFTSVVRLLDAIEGSVLMRTFCLPEDFIECFLGKVPAYVEDLVDDQLGLPHPSRQAECIRDA
ncbi:MAG: TetR/AcrR family transcriptional regulator [Arcanobacterium sp.]|nr:TetR/AcrR family transcriptional regulator [Arcanobacterium sp.]